MTRSAQTPRPSRQRAAVHALGVVLGVTIGVAIVAFGGVHAGTKAVLHGLVAAVLVLAASQARTVLERCGRVVPFAAAGGLLLLAGCAGLLPLPSFVGRLALPAWTEERGDVGWGFASLDPEATLGALSSVLLPLGFGIAVAVWGTAVWRRSRMETALLAAGAGVIALAVAHVLLGTSELFGLVEPRYTPGRFFAPFVNPNHFGGFLVLVFPVALGSAIEPTVPAPRRGFAGGLAAAVALAAIWAGAGGPLVVLAAQAAAVLWQAGLLRWWAALPAVAGGAVAATTLASLAGGEPGVTLGHRARLWGATARLAADHWLLGSGLGTFRAAVSPYRRDHLFQAWDHVHDDWLEWVAETGLAGVVLLLAALVVVRPGAARGPARAAWLTIALLGVALHAVVDFPLHVPAIAMGAAAVLAWRVAIFQHRTASPVVAVRAALLALAVIEVGAGLWQVRAAAVEPAAAALAEAVGPLERHRRVVGVLGPWRAELAVDRARTAYRERDPGAPALARALAADHPADADAQRQAAVVLAGTGAAPEAALVADRAVARAPWDWRTWHVRAWVADRAGDPDAAAAAWRDALRAEVPGALEEGWKRVPVGVYWVDAVDGGSLQQRTAVASFVFKSGDPDAAILGFETIAREHPERPLPLYVDALLAVGRADDARAYLATTLQHRPGHVELTRRLATLEEEAGRFSDAERLWSSIEGQHAEARLRATLAKEASEGPERALAYLDQHALVGTRLRPREVIERARLLGTLHRNAECIETLAGSGVFSDRKLQARAREVATSCSTERE